MPLGIWDQRMLSHLETILVHSRYCQMNSSFLKDGNADLSESRPNITLHLSVQNMKVLQVRDPDWAALKDFVTKTVSWCPHFDAKDI